MIRGIFCCRAQFLGWHLLYPLYKGYTLFLANADYFQVLGGGWKNHDVLLLAYLSAANGGKSKKLPCHRNKRAFIKNVHGDYMRWWGCKATEIDAIISHECQRTASSTNRPRHNLFTASQSTTMAKQSAFPMRTRRNNLLWHICECSEKLYLPLGLRWTVNTRTHPARQSGWKMLLSASSCMRLKANDRDESVLIHLIFVRWQNFSVNRSRLPLRLDASGYGCLKPNKLSLLTNFFEVPLKLLIFPSVSPSIRFATQNISDRNNGITHMIHALAVRCR